MTQLNSHETFSCRRALSEEHADRRADDRFPIVREVHYKVIRSRCPVETGTGKTINISRTGVLFEAEVPLPPGKRLALSISWPGSTFDGKCGLNLVARGWIVRCQGRNVALEVESYEFRTAVRAGIAPLADRGMPPAKVSGQANWSDRGLR